MRQQKLDAKFHKRASNWTRVADRCNAEFFEIFSFGKAPVIIPELHHDGRILTDPADLLAHATSFYEDLYSAPEDTKEARQARTSCLQSIPRLVTESQNDRLTAPIQMEELDEVVAHLPMGKEPGCD